MMVNRLPGVRKVDEHSMYTRGVFQSDFEHLNQNLYTFISMVPTDNDMFREGGRLYHESSSFGSRH